MTGASEDILQRFRRDHARDHATDINLTLRPAYRDALARLGNPHQKLPPVFHVAGTNGKGSTCAFLRAICEAAGYRVHVYTSPHLVHFHERIRIAGKLIDENELVSILSEIEAVSAPGDLSYFEAATVAAFVAFARHPADVTILEVGLGGRLDATNVIDRPLASLISRISYDHREYLGERIGHIAREKAGIMRAGVPCFIAPQPEATVVEALYDAGRAVKAPLRFGGIDWRIEPRPQGFIFRDETCALDLPVPALLGQHQFSNAGLAIAALSVLPAPPDSGAIRQGLKTVDWPARLQRLEQGALAALLPQGWGLWLDGGHNDSAGEVLAMQAEAWQAEREAKSLHVICGMLTTKNPQEFLKPLAPFIASLCAVTIPDEPQSFAADALAMQARQAGVSNVRTADSIPAAINLVTAQLAYGRLLICGSLYLAGDVLRQNIGKNQA